MMDEMDRDGMEEDLIVIEDDEGHEYTFRVEEYFFYNGDEYALLVETEESAAQDGSDPMGAIVCRIETGEDENGEETEEFIPVEDVALAERLFEIAKTRLTEDEEEDEE